MARVWVLTGAAWSNFVPVALMERQVAVNPRSASVLLLRAYHRPESASTHSQARDRRKCGVHFGQQVRANTATVGTFLAGPDGAAERTQAVSYRTVCAAGAGDLKVRSG